MDNALPVILVVGGIVLVAVFGYLSYLAAKKRREAFQRVAMRLNLSYRPSNDFSLPGRYRFLDQLDQGDNRYAYNVLQGTYKGQQVLAFDYHFETYSTDSKGNRTTHHHYFNFFILFLPRPFPELRIYPENFLSRIGQALGFDDIDFESVEFSRAFTVRSTDKKFAYDVCNARMMEHLLNDRAIALEIEGNCMALAATTTIDPEQIPAQFDRLLAVRTFFPDYLFS